MGKPLGNMLDIRGESVNMTKLVEFCDYHLARVDAFTDGEVVDALEHFFWGMNNGVAMELGALDGAPGTRSQTYEYEKNFGWKRILIEGNPSYRTNLIAKSPLAFSANAAICEKAMTVHYSGAEYVGGIVEFMSLSFMKEYHGAIYKACTPPGNVSSLNFTAVGHLLKEVNCVPLSTILHKARVRHINYFILDVEVSSLWRKDYHSRAELQPVCCKYLVIFPLIILYHTSYYILYHTSYCIIHHII
jgi:hypothetical protein